MLGNKKHQFYVQFLGWVETNGMRGTRYTDPVVADLRGKARNWKHAPKLTLQVSKKEMKITQDMHDEKKKNGKKIKMVKFPIIPSRDITYAVQSLNPQDGQLDDVVACIYLGYVPRTQRYVHVHVYRFDSPDTATTFVRILNQIIGMNSDRTADIERELIVQGHIEDPRAQVAPYRVPVHNRGRSSRDVNRRFNSSDGMHEKPTYEDYSGDSASFSDEGYPSGSDEIEPDLQSLKESVPFDSVTEELKTRLRLTESKNAAPLLLPPKDYDTVCRRHGDLSKTDRRKCLQLPIVGDRARMQSDESGVEIPSPEGSEGKQPSMDISDEKISTSVHSSSNGAPSPPMSPSTGYEIYSPRSVMTPRTPSTPHSPATPRSPMSQSSRNSSVYERQNSNGYMRQNSNGYERYPTRSRPSSSRSSGNFSQSSGTVFYNGPQHVSDIPPTDYESEAPILRQNYGGRSNRDLAQSMPAAMLQQELENGYAVVPQRQNRHSAKYSDVMYSPRMEVQAPRSPASGVRRTHSMYR